MNQGDGVPLRDRVRRGSGVADNDPFRQPVEERRGQHCWVVDSPGHPGCWPGVLIEWRRAEDGWEGLVAYVMPELRGRGVRLVERWVAAAHLEQV